MQLLNNLCLKSNHITLNLKPRPCMSVSDKILAPVNDFNIVFVI